MGAILSRSRLLPLRVMAGVCRPVPFIARLPGHVARAIQYRRDLRALRQLDDRLLRDVGLTREDVDRMARQEFRRLIFFC